MRETRVPTWQSLRTACRLPRTTSRCVTRITVARCRGDAAIDQHSTAQHSTAQHSTAQHSTAQHSTAQCVPLDTPLGTADTCGNLRLAVRDRRVLFLTWFFCTVCCLMRTTKAIRDNAKQWQDEAETLAAKVDYVVSCMRAAACLAAQPLPSQNRSVNAMPRRHRSCLRLATATAPQRVQGPLSEGGASPPSPSRCCLANTLRTMRRLPVTPPRFS